MPQKRRWSVWLGATVLSTGLCLVLGGCLPAAESEHVLTGQVLWGQQSVAGTTLELTRDAEGAEGPVIAQSVSDAGGRFVLANIPKGIYRLSATAPDSRYWLWQARGITVADNLTDFKVDLAQKLTLTAPADGAVLTKTPTLRWQSFPDAASYRVDLFNDQTGDLHLSERLTQTQLALSGPLSADTTYFWVVSAFDAAGDELAYGAAVFSTAD